MNERLKRLEELYFSKGQETKQPIDTTEGEPIETEQTGERWKPSQQNEPYWIVSAYIKPIQPYYYVNSLDEKLFNAGNCFKTEQEAQKSSRSHQAIPKQ
jgi:hypothetical protein